MTTTEPDETTPATRQEIRDRLNAIAPYPDDETPDHARALAKYLAVSAQRRWKFNLDTADMTSDSYRKSVQAMMGEFAALHLLMTLIENWPQPAEQLSREIRNAWDDGGGIGEWLFEHLQALGIDSAEVDRLEAAWRALAPAQPSVTGYGPSADALRLEHERDEARAVVREMCAHWERIGATREEDELIPQWRERAGIEAGQ